MDNPRKKKADGKRVSQQSHEQTYQKRKTGNSGTSNGRNAGGSRRSSSPGSERNGNR